MTKNYGPYRILNRIGPAPDSGLSQYLAECPSCGRERVVTIGEEPAKCSCQTKERP